MINNLFTTVKWKRTTMGVPDLDVRQEKRGTLLEGWGDVD